MKSPHSRVYGSAASREIDAYAIAHLGVSGYELMNRAADAAFSALLQNFPGLSRLSVWCGKGNNAGDAYLVAERAHKYGIQTRIIALVDPAQLSGDAATAQAQARQAGVPMAVGLPAGLPAGGAAESGAATRTAIVDGLLGTGLNGSPREPFSQAIAAINDSGLPVLSIDLPSGVSADTGAVYGQAVNATLTVSFITRKAGLYTGAGVSCAGRREFADLGVPRDMYVADGLPLLHWDKARLPQLDANTYKHRQGHVVVAGGDSSMPGAVAMATEAALRVGAGMVTAVTHAGHAGAIVARTPEVMVRGFYAGQSDEDANTGTEEVLARADMVVLGPGLGRSSWSEVLYHLVEQSGKPVLLDADGLYWLAQQGRWRGGDLTITPHVAEAARLLDCSVTEVQADRFAACTVLHERYGCRGVLKGAGSIAFTGPEPNLTICAHGNPGMATAGMGDVLSGVAGGLMAAVADDPHQADERLCSAIALHSAAGDRAAETVGQLSLIATDVTRALPDLLMNGR